MKATIMLLVMVAVLLVNLCAPVVGEAQTAMYAFAFATQSENTIQINLLAPAESTGYIVGDTFLVPASHMLADAATSPDGRYIAFGFYVGGRGTKAIEVWDTQTGTLSETGAFTPWSDDMQQTTEPFAPYLWSPDSTRLAYIGSPEGQSGPTDVYIYSLTDQSVTNLTDDDRYQYRFAWSHDGSYLAVLAGAPECSSAPCEITLEIWDIVGGTKTAVYDLNPFLALPISPWAAACYLEWSPGNTYVSLMMGCDRSTGFFSDMYVLNRSGGTITRLTRFGGPAVLWDTQVQFGVSFASVWPDSQTLLIGSAARPVFPDPGPDAIQISQTAAYAVPDWAETILSSTTATEWALNPVSGQLAYRAAAYLEHNPYAPEDIAVQIATLAENELIAQVQAPVGCHLGGSSAG